MSPKLHPDAEKFREYLEFDCASSTAYNYSRDVSKFLVHVDKPLGAITPLDITDWYQSLEGTYSARTIWRYGWALRKFFDIMGLPEMKRRTPIVAYDVPEPRWLSKVKTLTLIGDVPVLCVGYDLALRVGEVKYLKQSTYNPNNGNIEVTRLKHKGRRNTYILQVSDWCLEILNEYLGVDPDHAHERDDVMFPMSVEAIQTVFNERARRLGLSGYTFHSLRHSRVTHIALQQLQEAGVVDELSLSKFAGHLRVETTRMYVHLATRHLAFSPVRRNENKGRK